MVDVRQTSLPVAASCALMKQTSSLYRVQPDMPAMTLPRTTIGPEVYPSQFGVGDFRVPHEFPRTRIHSNDVGVTGSGKYLVAEDGNIPLNTSAGVASLGGLCRSGTILPDQIPSRSIERLNDAPGVWQVHDAVVDKRRGFIRAGIVHRPGPGELELGHILPGNLIKRTVAPCIISAPPVQPIPRRRIPQHGLGHWAKFFDLREKQQAAGEYRKR